MAYKNKVLEKIKQYISEYDSIYITANKDYIYSPFFQNILSHGKKKYLLLAADYEKRSKSEYGIDIHTISREEYDEIKNLYYLYEFSDRIHFLDENMQCGSLDNYIINGLLTAEEAAMTLLE